jgi:hypothetical protein
VIVTESYWSLRTWVVLSSIVSAPLPSMVTALVDASVFLNASVRPVLDAAVGSVMVNAPPEASHRVSDRPSAVASRLTAVVVRSL